MAGLNGSGLSESQFWILVGAAVLALVVTLVDISMAVNNGTMRKEANARQQYINQSVQLTGFHTQLVQGLASLAAKSGDEALKELLAKHGVTYSVNSQGTANPSGSAGVGQ